MKQVIFVLNLFIVIVCIMGDDDVTDRMAEMLSISKTDVEMCMNKTNVNISDLMKMDELIDDDITTTEINKSALKVGCLFACLLQKKDIMSGTYINVEKLKEMMNAKTSPNLKFIAKRNQILDTCANRVLSKIDKCEVILKFYLCTIEEFNRMGTQRIKS